MMYENQVVSKSENLLNLETSDSISLPLFTRTDGECNNHNTFSTCLADVLFSAYICYLISPGPEYKNVNTISMPGERLYQVKTAKRQLV